MIHAPPQTEDVPAFEPFSFRGRTYIRGPLSARDWLQLSYLLNQFKQAKAEGDLKAALAEAVDELHSQVRPAHRLARLRYRLARNPFKDASPAEIGVLIGLIARGAAVPSRVGGERGNRG